MIHIDTVRRRTHQHLNVAEDLRCFMPKALYESLWDRLVPASVGSIQVLLRGQLKDDCYPSRPGEGDSEGEYYSALILNSW